MSLSRLNLLMAAVLFIASAALAADIPPATIGLLGGAEIYDIDTDHSYLGFKIGLLGVSDVRGTFRDYDAAIVYDELHPERTSVTVVIEAKSIDTSSDFRDRDLKGEPFFDVEKNPNIIFQSTGIEPKGNDRFLVHGTLTIKGVARPVTLEMTRTRRRALDPAWGNVRIGGSGSVEINRKDFGIVGGKFWGNAIADSAAVTLDILGIRPNYDHWSFNSKEKPSAGEVVLATAEASGGAAAAEQFRTLKRDKPNDYSFTPNELGIAVNRLLQKRKVNDALELLKAAIEAYPDRPGFFARLGEVYATLGDRDRAIAMYEKASALAPSAAEPMEMLRRLRAVALSPASRQ
jgi:polyisoprenoid-binding protein YceI